MDWSLKQMKKIELYLKNMLPALKIKLQLMQKLQLKKKIKQKVNALVYERAHRLEIARTNKTAAANLEKELIEGKSSGVLYRIGILRLLKLLRSMFEALLQLKLTKIDQLVSREIQAFRERAKRETKTSKPDGEKEEGERESSDHEHGHSRDRRDRDRDRDRYSRHHNRQYNSSPKEIEGVTEGLVTTLEKKNPPKIQVLRRKILQDQQHLLPLPPQPQQRRGQRQRHTTY
ncbi:hypothetical protein Pelo_18111 [Pelomyxa schiedti]|nr:hypothetical protein Pelo_18111 [Pelomyxa schiedti]